MMLSFDQITALLSGHPYVALLPLAVVEGPVVTFACGVLISIGKLNPLLAFGIVVAGDLIGDAILYSLGRWGGRRVLSFLGSHPRLAARVHELEGQLLRKAGRALIMGKLTHSVGAAVLLAAGLIRMPLGRFLVVSLGSTLLKSFLLLVAGYWIGSSYQPVLNYSSYLIGVLAVLGIGGLWALLFRHRQQGRSGDVDSTASILPCGDPAPRLRQADPKANRNPGSTSLNISGGPRRGGLPGPPNVTSSISPPSSLPSARLG